MRRNDFVLAVGISFLFLVVYFLTINQIFSFDAVTNAIACESNEPIRWFHPNHPLYPSLGVFYYHIEKLFGYPGWAIYSLARLNSILMAVALGILFLALRSFVNRWSAALSVIAFGVCYAVWHYAVDGRAVGTSVFFAALVILFMTRIQTGTGSSLKQMFVLALLSSLYILSHAIAVFHIIPVGWWLWSQQKSPIKLALYLTSVLIIVLTVYISIYMGFGGTQDLALFLSWAVGYAGFQGGINTLKSEYWIHDLHGLLNGFWEGWKNAFVPSYPSQEFWRQVGSGGAALVIMGIVVWAWVKSRKQSPEIKALSRLLFVWGLLCLLFITFWSPGVEGFRLHVLTPWLVGVVLNLGGNRGFVWGPAIIATVFFTVNITGSIGYAATITSNQGYQYLKELDGHMKKWDVFLCAENNFIPNVEVYRPYFFPWIQGGTLSGRLMAFRESSLEPLSKRLDMHFKNGSSLFWGSDLLDPSIQEKIEKEYLMKRGSIQAMMNRYHLQRLFSLPGGRHIYVTRHS